MRVGTVREIKNHEYRVGLVPAGVRELVAAGHQVLVQSSAGAGIGVDDSAYAAAGAKIVATAKDVFDGAEIWGDDAAPGLTVSIDAWESYLEHV